MASQVLAKHTSEGVIAAVRETIKPEENYLGPVMRWLVTLQYIAFRGDPALWHAAKILQHLLLAVGIYFLALEVGSRRVAAVLASAFCSFMDPPSQIAFFQTYAVSYARLFATDSYYIPFAVWGIVFFLRALRASAWKSSLLPGGGMILFLGLAGLTKLSFLPIACALGVAGLATMIARFRDRAALLVSVSVFVQMVIAFIPGLLFFQPWKKRTVEGYDSVKLASSFGEWRATALPFAENLIEVTSLLLPVAVLAVCTAIVLAGWRAVRHREPNPGAFALTTLALCFGGSFVFQGLWPIVISRYALVFAPYFAVLVVRGLEITLIQCGGFLSAVPSRARLAVVAVGAVVAMLIWSLLFAAYYNDTPPYPGRQLAVLVPVALFCLVAAACGLSSIVVRNPRIRLWLCAPGFFLILGKIAWMAPFLVGHTREMIHGYINREKTLGVLFEQCARMSAEAPEGKSATMYVNLPNGEEYWSIGLVNRHLLGISNVKPGKIDPAQPMTLAPYDAVTSLIGLRMQAERRIPPFLGGRSTQVMPMVTGNAQAFALDQSKPRVVEMTLSKPFSLTMVGLAADPLGWDRQLDLEVAISIDGGQPRKIGSFFAEDVPRGRVSEPMTILPETVELPAGLPIRFHFRAVPSATLGPPLNADARIVISQGNSYEGRTIAPSPRMRLVGFDPAAPAMALVVRETFTSEHRVVLSPAGLFLGYWRGIFWSHARVPLADRRYRYTDVIEVYEAPARDS